MQVVLSLNFFALNGCIADVAAIEDNKLIEKLNNAIENREFEKEGFGNKTYRFEDVKMVNNYCQGSFSSYEITID